MNNLRDEVKQDMNNLRDKVKQDMNHLEEKIQNRQLLFEDEYGRKIDAIFDYVQFHQKTNLQRFEKIDELEERVSVLEKKQV